MPSIINSDDGVISGTSGLKTTGGNDGVTTFQQNGTESMRITSAGEVLVGGTTEIPAASGCLTVQRGGQVLLSLFRNDTSVVSGDVFGDVRFYGNDTTSNTPTLHAYVRAEASGTHAAGDNPTDLVFGVTPDNSATVAEEMRLTSQGALAFGGAANYGTSGQVLTSQGNASPTWTTISSGGATGIAGQVFAANGTFTIPSGVTAVKVTVVGGGAAGGGANSSPTGPFGGGGGGGGGTAIKYLTGLTPGNTLSVTVGAAAGTSSVASGTQSITTVSATGGAAGGTSVNGNYTGGGNGGIGSNGDLNLAGNAGTGGNEVAGRGGSSIFAGGGLGGNGYSNGSAGRGYGAGGGGASVAQSCQSRTGGAGVGGVVVFEY